MPDYPARLDVPYPERLSRGLVLVKWWLLALPHYVILRCSSAAGCGWPPVAHWERAVGQALGCRGLLGPLVLITAVMLLFTGRYPLALHDSYWERAGGYCESLRVRH